jgi:hypothetical protein
VVGVDRGFEMTSSKFHVARLPIPAHPVRVIRAQSNRLLYVRFCLIKAAEGYFRHPSRSVEERIVRIDGEAGVGDTDRLVKTLRQRQVAALCSIRRVVIWGESDRAV